MNQLNTDLSIFLNALLMSLVGVSLDFLFMSRIFTLRRRPVLWVFYFIVRSVVDGIFDILFLSGNKNAILSLGYAVFILGTAAATYWIQYYTWDTDLLKVGIGALLSDMMGALCVVIALTAVNLACGREASASYQTPLRPDSIPLAVLSLILAILILRPWRFLMQRLISWQPAHRRLYLTLLFILIAFSNGTQLTDLENISVTAAFLLIVGSLILFASLWMVRQKYDREKMFRNFADARQKMLFDYREVIAGQMKTMELNREYLRRYEEDLNMHRDQEAPLLQKLRDQYCMLQHGQYSDNTVLDAVLSGYALQLGRERIDAEFSAAAYHGDGEDAAMLAMYLPEWARDALKNRKIRGKEKTDERGETDKQASVRFSVFSEKNQTVLRLTVFPPGRTRFSGAAAHAAKKMPGTTVSERWEKGEKEILILREEGGAE